MRFHDHAICIYCKGWIDCRDAFHVALCLNATWWAESELVWSIPANRFSTNNLLDTRQELIMVISQKKQRNEYKEKWVILQSIGIIVIKSKSNHLHLQIF